MKVSSVVDRLSRLFERRPAGAADSASSPAPAAPDGREVDLRRRYHSLRVAKRIRETPDSCSIVFEVPEALQGVFAYKAGQFLTLEVPYDGLALRRCYSLASSPDWEREHKVTVKRVDGGRISNWINDQLQEGDQLQVLPPEGRFVMTYEAQAMVLFAGGSGITPCISLVKSALRTTDRRIKLVYSNRNAESVIFDAELTALERDYQDRFELVRRLDNVDGSLRLADIELLCRGWAEAEFFLCGPELFMDMVEAGLASAGVDLQRVHVERFLSPADPASQGARTAVPADAEVPDVFQVELRGKCHDIPYPAGATLLQAALQADVEVPYSCEEGFCGCCMAELVDGEVDMDSDEALSPTEKKKGFVLVCQSRPRTKQCKIRFPSY